MINKLVANIKKTGAPIVVGLDPMLSYVPEQYRKRHLQSMARLWKEQQKLSGSSTKRSWIRLMI